jgi:hypothetical protein
MVGSGSFGGNSTGGAERRGGDEADALRLWWKYACDWHIDGCPRIPN